MSKARELSKLPNYVLSTVAVFTQWITPVAAQETYTNISVTGTTKSQILVYSNAPNGYWLNIIVLGKLL